MIEIECLTKRFGAHVAVEGLSLQVPAGCVFGFLGPNGAGKTTTIRVLLGLLRPSSGSARIDGRDCWSQGPAARRALGYLPGDLRLPLWMTGRQALAVYGAARRHDLQHEGAALAADLELDLEIPVRSMSRGTRQKLGLVLALALRPRVLVLDEPTTALDPLTCARVQVRLRALAAAGCAVFFSSHVLSEVEELCERVAILRQGRLIADEPLQTLRRRASRTITVRFATGQEHFRLPPPAFLQLDAQRPHVWEGRLRGSVPELLAWLHGKPVEDLTIGPPDLDGLFHSYYAAGTEPEAGA